MIRDATKKTPMYNILFIATYQNYFVQDHANFNRMYNNLIFFHNHKKFNVIVLQPKRGRLKENKNLKKGIISYYFKEIDIFNNNLVPFLDFNPFFIRKVQKIIKNHNIHLIHIEFLYGLNIIKLISKTPISYNAYNVEYIFTEEVGKYYHKLPKIFRKAFTKYIYYLEKFALNAASSINTVSHMDKKKIIEMYKVNKKKIFISPFGYRDEIFKNPLSKSEARKNLNVDGNKFVVIFHGSYKINYANQEAIFSIENKIIPKIEDKDVLFLIAGDIPHSKSSSKIKYLGFVENLRDFIYSADIAIAPIFRGSGVKTKIIDYLSGGIPVITTRKGAEGLLIRDNVHGFIINDSAEEFINKILYLKSNKDLIKNFKENIRELILKKYNWKKILMNLAIRYEKLAKHNLI